MNRVARTANRYGCNALDEIARPFAGDLLERTRLADKLTGYINRVREGAVIALDASWGEGKTWFAKNWAARLQREGHPVVYIDAFAQNSELDPFFIVAAELALLLEDERGTGDAIRSEAARLMNAMVPLTGRLAAVKTVSASPSSPKESAHDTSHGKTSFQLASDDTVNWIDNRLKAWPAEKALFANFRTTLGRIVAACDKPIVIVIDELDRCRPTFAIRFLERIRHYFDMPNLIFVLPVNRIQLYEAVKSVYGSDTDAGAYLHKFIDFFLSLPRFPSNDTAHLAHIRSFITGIFTRHGLDTATPKRQRFIELMTAWAALVPLTLQEIERAVTLYILADEPPEQGIATFLIVLKIRKPEWLGPLLKNDPKILAVISEDFLAKIVADSQKLPLAPDRYFRALQSFFNSEKTSHLQDRQVITQFQTDVLDPNSFYIESLEEIAYLIRMIAGSLDLTITD